MLCQERDKCLRKGIIHEPESMVFHSSSSFDKEDHISPSVQFFDMAVNAVDNVVPSDMTLHSPSFSTDSKKTRIRRSAVGHSSEKGLLNRLQSFPKHACHRELSQQASEFGHSSEMTPIFLQSLNMAADIGQSPDNSHMHIHSFSNPAHHGSQTQLAEIGQNTENSYAVHSWLPNKSTCDASSFGSFQEYSGSNLVISDLNAHGSFAQSSNSQDSCPGYNSLRHKPIPDAETTAHASAKHQHISDSVNCHRCDICFRAFGTLTGVNIHKRVHTDYQPPFRCNICQKDFRRSSTLYQHKRKHNTTETQPSYTCIVCGKEFNFQANLTVHSRVHTGYRPYKCDMCDKSFTQSSALNCHRRIHTDERPFICNFCGRKFRQSVGLTYHKRTHTGEKPYKCSSCGKEFSQWGSLSYHKRTHTGERSYKCERV